MAMARQVHLRDNLPWKRVFHLPKDEIVALMLPGAAPPGPAAGPGPARGRGRGRGGGRARGGRGGGGGK
eukprot:1716287-Pyramimonas_sp.AAC.1